MGNTKPSVTISKKQISESKYWCFTWNNYIEAQIATIVSTFDKMKCNYIFEKEIGDEEKTPHLQGYVESPKKIRGTAFGLPKQIHWEKRKGSQMDNLIYCSKEYREYNGPKELKPDLYISGFTLPRTPRPIVIPELYGWQLQIKEIFEADPVDRKIFWTWSAAGNRGKSTMVR